MLKIEIRDTEEGTKVFAKEHIYQGETIIKLPTIEYSPNHSLSPNARIRGNRIVAWECIEKDDEITLNYYECKGMKND